MNEKNKSISDKNPGSLLQTVSFISLDGCIKNIMFSHINEWLNEEDFFSHRKHHQLNFQIMS